MVEDDDTPASADDDALDAPEGEAEDDPLYAVLRAMAHAPPLDIDGQSTQPQAGQLVAHFVVLERLGAGGMGVVYKAKDLRLERLVALKVLSSRYVRDATCRNLLLREARSAAAVTHPNIAAIYEVGEADGVAFIAMELVTGTTLRSRLRGAPMPTREAIEIGWEIARGLARAHRARIVHRDLKPDNVMVGEDGQIKILDFGLAKPLEEQARARPSGPDIGSAASPFASDGAVLGTPAYMSPEQRAGAPVDARSDVFSFGLLLHELLTGRLPERDGAAASPPETVSASSISRVPPRVLSLVARCLQIDREARFTDGAALEAELALVRTELALPARATPRSRSVRGSRVVTGSGVLLLSALVVAAGVRARGRASGGAAPAPLASPPVVAPAPAPPALRRLTANPADNPILHAAISPDARSLAYVDKSGAYVQRLGVPAQAPLRITLPEQASAELVAWMPASDLLVVSGQERGKEGKELWLVTSGGAIARSLGRGNFTGLAVSPDGARLAFAEEERVATMALDGARPRIDLVRKEPGCFITELSWSPDGGRVAYENLCFSSLRDAAIETVDARGGAPVVAVADARLAAESGVGGMVWTADGRLVYALAEWFPAENGTNLWSVGLDARSGAPVGAAKKLTAWASTLASVLSVDRTGRHMAFLRFDFQADVYVGDLEGGGRALSHPRRLTLSDRNERPSAWSADGKGVYFISDRNGLYDVFFQGVLDAQARAIVAEPGSETGLQLTPGGDALLYWQLPPIETPRTVHPTLMRAALDGTGAARVWTAAGTTYPEGAGRPQPWEMRFRCARAGGRDAPCVLSEKEGSALVFRLLDPARGTGAELLRVERPTAAAFFWDLSPDGTRLATPSENGPVRIETLHGAFVGERRVPAGCDPIYATWSADGTGLFVSAECSNAPVFRLYFLPESGGPELLWDASPDWLLNTEASPDGKRLAIAVKHADNDVWLVDDVP